MLGSGESDGEIAVAEYRTNATAGRAVIVIDDDATGRTPGCTTPVVMIDDFLSLIRAGLAFRSSTTGPALKLVGDVDIERLSPDIEAHSGHLPTRVANNRSHSCKATIAVASDNCLLFSAARSLFRAAKVSKSVSPIRGGAYLGGLTLLVVVVVALSNRLCVRWSG